MILFSFSSDLHSPNRFRLRIQGIHQMILLSFRVGILFPFFCLFRFFFAISLLRFLLSSILLAYHHLVVGLGARPESIYRVRICGLGGVIFGICEPNSILRLFMELFKFCSIHDSIAMFHPWNFHPDIRAFGNAPLLAVESDSLSLSLSYFLLNVCEMVYEIDASYDIAKLPRGKTRARATRSRQAGRKSPCQ